MLRPGGIYGPRDTDLLPLFEMAGKGWLVAPASSPPLQPVYVSDVARLTVAAGTGEFAGLGPYPVAEEGRYRWREVRQGLAEALGRRVRMIWLPKTAFVTVGMIAEAAARLTGRDPPLDRRNAVDLSRHGWTCDTTMTRDAFGWEAEIGLHDGLAVTAEYAARGQTVFTPPLGSGYGGGMGTDLRLLAYDRDVAVDEAALAGAHPLHRLFEEDT